ncbi:MAG: apolipoprotein N-acyltransferase [Actinomycetota bacterium]
MARLAAAALSGVLAAVSRPPLDVGPLVFVALVPLFLAWSGCSIRTRSVLAFTAGAVYYAVTCSWMRYFGTVAVIPFVVACAAYWAAVGAGVGWLARRRIAGPFVTAALWVVADAGVSRYPFGGISWGEVGYSLHDLVPARTLAGVGGIALVTFAVVAVNGFVADLVRARGATRASRALAGLAAIVVVATAVTVTRTPPAPTARFRVALVQGNDLNRDLTAAEASDRYLTRNHLRLAEGIRDPVDLIVFPESSMDGDPRSDREIATALARLARRHDAWVLANATVDADATGIQAENLDVLFAPDGRVAGTYAKRHLVPFGEYVPFRRIVTAIVPAAGEVARDYRPGPGPVLFRIDGTPMAPIICFESAFGAEDERSMRLVMRCFSIGTPKATTSCPVPRAVTIWRSTVSRPRRTQRATNSGPSSTAISPAPIGAMTRRSRGPSRDASLTVRSLRSVSDSAAGRGRRGRRPGPGRESRSRVRTARPAWFRSSSSAFPGALLARTVPSGPGRRRRRR